MLRSLLQKSGMIEAQCESQQLNASALLITPNAHSVKRLDFNSYLGKEPCGTTLTMARKPKALRIAEVTFVAVSVGFVFVVSIWTSSSSRVSVL